MDVNNLKGKIVQFELSLVEGQFFEGFKLFFKNFKIWTCYIL